MQLNKIYRYYGIPTSQAYTQLKEKFTEAFTGFDGVSFETIEATDETTEKYNIYLDSDKSTWLTIYTDSDDKPQTSINFRDGTAIIISQIGSAYAYRQFNIVRTAYGVAFSNIGTATTTTDILDDKYITSFFVAGSPNVFVYTKANSNTQTTAIPDYWHSNLHEMPEAFSCFSGICSSAVTRTKIVNASSMVQDIDCEHLYRMEFTDGKVGKIKVGEKYVILGTRYALEYDPNDDGKEV